MIAVIVLAGVGKLGLQHRVVDVDRQGLRHQLGDDTLVTSSELPGLNCLMSASNILNNTYLENIRVFRNFLKGSFNIDKIDK